MPSANKEQWVFILFTLFNQDNPVSVNTAFQEAQSGGNSVVKHSVLTLTCVCFLQYKFCAASLHVLIIQEKTVIKGIPVVSLFGVSATKRYRRFQNRSS